MICEQFSQLTPFEKIQFIGKLLHAVQNDNFLFNAGNDIIRIAEKGGLFDKVKILPEC